MADEVYKDSSVDGGEMPEQADTATSFALEIVREQVAALQQERERLRAQLEAEQAARLEAEKRAAAAEAELKALTRVTPEAITMEQETGTETVESKDQEDNDSKRSWYGETKWWEFWKRWKRQDPWGFGNTPRYKK